MNNKSKFITDKIVETVFWVNTLFKGEVTFCGSFGLVFNGKLDRQIHDIDCITDKEWYGKKFYDEMGQFGTSAAGSEKFQVNGVWVKVFKIYCPNGIPVDVMFREDGVKSEKHSFGSGREIAEIRVEVPESAIEVKKNYLKIANRTPDPESVEKHSSDIDFITGK